MKTARRSAFLALALLVLSAVPSAWAVTKTYTLDTDFDLGALLNVNHNAPNNDQLQLDSTTTPFPFVNIACSNRGTAVRIDVNSGAILGEYLTAPDLMGRNPSRTTVDRFGNVWVSNRAETGSSGGQNKGSIVRIGLVIGGTRCDSDGTPNPVGQYLKPPFSYNTCVDRDNDGLIKTSRGLGNILPWTNVGGADTHGGVSTAEDESIINYTRVTGTATRTVAVDANNDVWVGGLGDKDHEKLSGVTGLPLPGTQINLGCGGYGGLIDGNGVLWSASGCATSLLRYDPALVAGACLGSGRGDYGLGIDPNTGHIWHSTLCEAGLQLHELDAAGNVLNSYPQPFQAQGVCVDGNSHVWLAELFGSQVWHLAPDPSNPGTHLSVGIVGGFLGTTGVAVDANGKIWASETTDRASRIDPSLGLIGGGGYTVGAIDLSVPLGPGAGPYNYSDMTGFVSIGVTSPSGTWTVVFDGGQATIPWQTVAWNSSEPAGSSVGAEVRAAENAIDLPGQTFVSVTNGGAISGVTGRFIEIRSTLARNVQGASSPILYDLTVNGLTNRNPDCSAALACTEVLWPPNHKYQPVSICGVTDPDGDPVTITVTGITQDEPINTRGDGNTCPDGQIVAGQALVRAERTGTPGIPGNGRVYTIRFTATDGKGGECTGSVGVCVPHDQGDPVCIKDGPAYNSLGSCTGANQLGPEAVSLTVVHAGGPRASLSFELPGDGPVQLAIFDVAGRRLVTLESGLLARGVYERIWDMTDFSSGLYFARLQAGGITISKRILKTR